jgi:hypothetical protein
MSNNTFIFSWDMYGIETILPISKYEHWEHEQLLQMLAGQDRARNPLHNIIQGLLLRAKFNSQRRYEIYAVACNEECDEAFWQQQWKEFPQETANIIRERGHKLYSDRIDTSKVKIT